jgi:hypothetical protein
MKRVFFYIWFSSIILLADCFVDQPNLLFPVLFGPNRRSQIQVSAGDGCFYWNPSKRDKDVLIIKAKETECQSKIIIEVINSEEETSAEIIAINKSSFEN